MRPQLQWMGGSMIWTCSSSALGPLVFFFPWTQLSDIIQRIVLWEIWCHYQGNGHTREGQFGIVDAGKDMVIPHCDNMFDIFWQLLMPTRKALSKASPQECWRWFRKWAATKFSCAMTKHTRASFPQRYLKLYHLFDVYIFPPSIHRWQ